MPWAVAPTGGLCSIWTRLKQRSDRHSGVSLHGSNCSQTRGCLHQTSLCCRKRQEEANQAKVMWGMRLENLLFSGLRTELALMARVPGLHPGHHLSGMDHTSPACTGTLGRALSHMDHTPPARTGTLGRALSHKGPREGWQGSKLFRQPWPIGQGPQEGVLPGQSTTHMKSKLHRNIYSVPTHGERQQPPRKTAFGLAWL